MGSAEGTKVEGESSGMGHLRSACSHGGADEVMKECHGSMVWKWM